MIFAQIRCIGNLLTPKCQPRRYQYLLNVSVHGAWTIFGLASCIIQWLCNDTYPYSMYQPPFNRNNLAKWSWLSPTIERQWSINNLWSCILHNPTAVQRHLPIFHVSAPFQPTNVSLGFLISIINTTFIELSTATYLRNSVLPHLILRLNLLHLYCHSDQSKQIPKSIASVDMNYSLRSNTHSSDNPSNGGAPVFKYHSTR